MFCPFLKLVARSSIWATVFWLTGTGQAGAEDVCFFRSVGELTITEGNLPMGAEGRFAQREQGIDFTSDWQLRTARQPYASLDVPGEIYLDNDPQRGGTAEQSHPGIDLNDLFHDDIVALRLSAQAAVERSDRPYHRTHEGSPRDGRGFVQDDHPDSPG